MATFAKGTSVAVERSRAELDALLKKHGATSRVIGQDDEHDRAVVGFALAGGRFRLNIPLPPSAEPLAHWVLAIRPYKPIPGRACLPGCQNDIAYASGAVYRCAEHVSKKTYPSKQQAQRERERWRLVILLVKAKLEAIRLGLSTANREFMADMITDDGRTLEEVLNTGGMTRLLNAGPAPTSKGAP